DSFVEAAARTGADAYITSDLRHHPALEHVEAAADATGVPALLGVSHAASGSLWLPLAKDLLARTVPDLAVVGSTRASGPWSGRGRRPCWPAPSPRSRCSGARAPAIPGPAPLSEPGVHRRKGCPAPSGAHDRSHGRHHS